MEALQRAKSFLEITNKSNLIFTFLGVVLWISVTLILEETSYILFIIIFYLLYIS